MTWEEVLKSGQEQLIRAGIAEAGLDAWYLFEKVFGISRARYYLCARDEAGVSEEQLSVYEGYLRRRAGHEPLQHILGTRDFMGMEFYVNRHTLIPRQDTETLVETVLSEQKKRDISVLDMCTGSGCIAISLKALGGYANVEAADISKEALKVAEANAEKLLSAENQIQFHHSDMFSAFDGKKFDVIVSNPPYIPTADIEELEPEVKDFEPMNALDGTADGLFFYRILAAECRAHLTENGCVYFEIGYDQGRTVPELLRAHGFTDTKVIKDLAGKDRVVCAKAGAVRTGQEVSYV